MGVVKIHDMACYVSTHKLRCEEHLQPHVFWPLSLCVVLVILYWRWFSHGSSCSQHIEQSGNFMKTDSIWKTQLKTWLDQPEPDPISGPGQRFRSPKADCDRLMMYPSFDLSNDCSPQMTRQVKRYYKWELMRVWTGCCFTYLCIHLFQCFCPWLIMPCFLHVSNWQKNKFPLLDHLSLLWSRPLRFWIPVRKKKHFARRARQAQAISAAAPAMYSPVSCMLSARAAYAATRTTRT